MERYARTKRSYTARLGLPITERTASPHVLGRHLELAGHVVFAELAQEGLVGVGIGEQVVEADAAAHKHLLHAGERAQLTEQPHVVLVAHVHLAADARPEAALAHAGAARELLLARGGWRKFAVGPPTSLMYPLKSGSSVMRRASSMRLSWLRACTMRPWWNVSAQKLHSPKHPRFEMSDIFTSLSAGTPPAVS